MKKLSVIGSGTMGSGIAQIGASHGWNVILFDINENALQKSKAKLEKILNRLIEKSRITNDEANEIKQNISYSNSLDDVSNSNLIVEAIIENIDIKKELFQKLETLVSQDCIIASNTSSLSITSLAAALKHPNRFLGIHFFNPAPLMKLVEIVPALQTDTSYIEQATDIITSWKKHTVIAKDTPGFIVNKVARPFYSESIRIFEEGLLDLPRTKAFATIDWALTQVAGFRMGPFTLMDFIGNDVNYTVTETVFKAFYYDGRYKPSFTQKRLSEAGYHGRKTGQGYYTYGENHQSVEPHKDEKLAKMIVERVVVMLINEAADTLHFNIASMEDIETAMTKGVNYPKGLFAWADEWGVEFCVNKLDQLFDEYREERYRCSPLLRKMLCHQKTFYNHE